MKFLFMDETYMALAEPGSATVLTGLLVPAATHAEFRKSYHKLLSQVVPSEPNTVPPVLAVHAASLFPELGDNDAPRFAFLEGIADLCLRMDFRIYRVGYLNTEPLRGLLKTDRDVLGLCFVGFLWALGPELEDGPVWPVMESDHSSEQDSRFAGQVRGIEHYTHHLPPSAISVDNTNLGELLYTTKHSSLGSMVDCVAYLRQARYLRAQGRRLTPFKQRLAKIGDRLDPLVVRDEVIDMKVDPSAGEG